MSAPVQTLVERLRAAVNEVAKLAESNERNEAIIRALEAKIARMENVKPERQANDPPP